MNSLPSTQAQAQAPRTRLGGAITFRGVEYTSAAALERALAGVVQDAGPSYTVRLTRKGEALAARLRAQGARS